MSVVGGKVTKRTSTEYDDDVAKAINDWRAKQYQEKQLKKIPSFNAAVNTLLRKALGLEVTKQDAL